MNDAYRRLYQGRDVGLGMKQQMRDELKSNKLETVVAALMLVLGLAVVGAVVSVLLVYAWEGFTGRDVGFWHAFAANVVVFGWLWVANLRGSAR